MCSKMTKQEICGRLRGSEHSVNTHSMSGCRDLPTSEQKPRSMDTHEPDIHSPDKIPHGSRENACLVRTTCDSSATCFLQPRSVQKPCVKSIPTTDNSSASDPRSPANTLCRCWWGCAQPQTACRVPVNTTTASCQTHHPRNRHYSRRRLIVAAVEKAQQFFPDHMNVSDGKQVGISGRPTSDRAAALSAGASAAAHGAPARKIFDPHPGRQIAACTPQAQRTGRKAHASQHRVHNLLFMTVAARNHEDQGSRQLMFLPTACFSARLAAVCHSHTQS